MESFTCIPRGLDTLVIINLVSFAFLGTATSVFLYLVAGPIALFIPVILSGLFYYLFKRKK